MVLTLEKSLKLHRKLNGAYCIWNIATGELVHVGKSFRRYGAKGRFREHYNIHKNTRDNLVVEFYTCDSHEKAKILECLLIIKYNAMFRRHDKNGSIPESLDDESYFKILKEINKEYGFAFSSYLKFDKRA